MNATFETCSADPGWVDVRANEKIDGLLFIDEDAWVAHRFQADGNRLRMQEVYCSTRRQAERAMLRMLEGRW
jgi:hypothetical protein